MDGKFRRPVRIHERPLCQRWLTCQNREGTTAIAGCLAETCRSPNGHLVRRSKRAGFWIRGRPVIYSGDNKLGSHLWERRPLAAFGPGSRRRKSVWLSRAVDGCKPLSIRGTTGRPAQDQSPSLVKEKPAPHLHEIARFLSRAGD